MTTTATITRRIATVAAGLAVLGSGFATEPAEARSPKPTVTEIELHNGAVVRIVDRNGDGVADIVYIDVSGDGKWDSAALDRDLDGRFDHRWEDRNGDGEPTRDEFTRIKTDKANKKNTCLKAKRAVKRPCLRRPHRLLGLTRMPKLVLPAADVQVPAQPQPPAQQPNEPQPAPQPPAPRPEEQDDRHPLDFGADVTGDGKAETFKGDPSEGPSESVLLTANGQSEVIVGTAQGQAKIHGKCDADNDRKDEDFVVADPNRDPSASVAVNLDPNNNNDGDVDMFVIGTRGGAEIGQCEDVDNDGEPEIVIYDPTRIGELPLYLDSDTDADVIVRGS